MVATTFGLEKSSVYIEKCKKLGKKRREIFRGDPLMAEVMDPEEMHPIPKGSKGSQIPKGH